MTALYVDSSAALKRVFVEPGSDDVSRLLRARVAGDILVAASTLTWIEVSRSVLRSGIDDAETKVVTALSGIAELPLDGAVVEAARRIGPPSLRSLDAIHLASAVTLHATEILTFDSRLADAARSVGVKAIP